VRAQPVPQQHHLLAGVEAGQSLEHPDEGGGVVVAVVDALCTSTHSRAPVPSAR
jgi:hypothetical protein